MPTPTRHSRRERKTSLLAGSCRRAPRDLVRSIRMHPFEAPSVTPSMEPGGKWWRFGMALDEEDLTLGRTRCGPINAVKLSSSMLQNSKEGASQKEMEESYLIEALWL